VLMCRSLELLVWCFQTQSTSFFGFFFGVNGSVRKKTCAKSHVLFGLRIMGFPQELETVRFNSEPKRYKSVSAKRSVFTLVFRQFSSGVEVCVETEKLRFPGGSKVGDRILVWYKFYILTFRFP
jgi:hypothetical protein